MAQFLKLTISGVEYLLPGTASMGIENREKMKTDTASGNIVGWKEETGKKWPAYAIDYRWNIDPSAQWQRVVFIPASPVPVGIGADSIEMLNDTDIEPVPFTPVGPAPSRAGHLFGSVWAEGDKAYLVINPSGVAGYFMAAGRQ